MKAYAKRDELLRQMGFASYEAYLKSDLWQWIKDRFKERWRGTDQWICGLCGTTDNLLLHHRSYDLDVLCGTNTKHLLVPICPACHTKIEFDEQGKKRTLEDANRMLFVGDVADSVFPSDRHFEPPPQI